MNPLATADATLHGKDPCLQIQVDLSAMLDGELDAPSVRRVMVHSDVCGSCRAFLESIRAQARAHQSLHDEGLLGETGNRSSGAEKLRRQLVENQRQLARILYELGRGFVLMGLSPDFSREIAKEPVPVPDMAMRGRSFLDEVERWANGAGQGVGGAWVSAKELFAQSQPRSAAENLAKGQRLLAECLAILENHHEARIYLGLVHHVRGQRALARKQFSQVLAGSDDPTMRAFALLNLGNVYIDEGDCEGAITLLRQLVDSGIIRQQPRFGMAYFNLALACGLLGRFEESHDWFRHLYEELPHKRALVARELTRRSQFVHLLRSHPEAEGMLAKSFPSWFPVTFREAC